YPWAKDAADNVSAVFATPATVDVDTTTPSVTAFTATSPSTSLDIPITSFTATDAGGVTGYLITVSATPPLPTNPGWQGSAPTTYTVGSDGTYTLYPWAKDAADNVSAVFATPATVDVDTTAPSVTAFTATSPSTSLNIPITSFTATDNAAVTGYLITESGTPPLPTNPGWTGSAPATYTVVSDGTYTLYPWAKDAIDNVSAVYAIPATVDVDTTAPFISSTIPNDLDTGVGVDSPVTITWSENVACATVDTVSVTISPVVGWIRSSCSGNQAVFSPSGQASTTLYTVSISTAVTDANGNAMAAGDSFSYTTGDAGIPTVTSFTATSPSNSLDIPITSFTATDNVAVTGYLITESATPPLPTNPGWQGSAPATYSVGSDGTYTLYPWAKDAADNVSAVFATPATVDVDTT
ncbi:MAG: Ig-like domain-containing protein, partial [Nitrospiraceae bacterium]